MLIDESYEEKEAKAALRSTTQRKRAASALSAKDSFKGLRERVAGSMHSRTGSMKCTDGGLSR